jgi:hypothetical protein
MSTSVAATFPGPPPRVGQPVFASGTTNAGVPPIIGSAPVKWRFPRLRPGYVLLLIVVALPVACALGIADFFHLSLPTRALRTAVVEAVPGQWHERVGINVGYFTCALARYASSFVKLPPEARAGIDSLRGAEVSISHLEESGGTPDFTALLARADKTMGSRHWQRIVGVVQDKQFVAVYAPNGLRSFKRASCCVVVLNGKELVVVSARANLTSLLDIIQHHIHEKLPVL